MENENKTKKALSMKEWILCIGAITILTLLMVLPPVFRIVFSDDKPNPLTPTLTPTPTGSLEEPSTTETAPIDDSQYEKIVCTKENVKDETYKEIDILHLAHENGQLKIYSSINKKVYSAVEETENSLFLEEKKSCDEIPRAYLTIRGFNYQCTSSENEIQLTQIFDIANFKEKRVKIDQEEKLISVPYYLNQNVRVVRKDLEKQGYVCEEIQPVATPTSEPTPTPVVTPTPTPVETPAPAPAPTETPTPTPVATIEPTPTPTVTPDPTPTLLP